MATIYGPSSKANAIPASSSVKTNAANYRVPASSASTKVNQVGNPVYANTPAKPYTTPSISQGGGNTPSGGGGGNPVQQQNFNQAPMEQAQEQQIDFESLYAPALQALDEAIAPLQQGFDSYQTGQLGQAETAKASTNQQISEQQGLLGQKGVQQTNLAENAQDKARRLHSEMTQGIQARYGGSTGTGGFAEGQLGNQTAQQIGQIRQSLSQSMGEINDKLVQVKEIGRIALQDIQDKTQDRIRQAKDSLDSNLNAIRMQKGEIQSQKAARAVEMMRDYQAEVRAINSRNTQFQQQLWTQQQTAEQNLKTALARGKTAAESYSLKNYQVGMDNPVGYRQGSQGTTTDLNGNPINLPQGAGVYDVGSYDARTRLEDETDPNAIPKGLG